MIIVNKENSAMINTRYVENIFRQNDKRTISARMGDGFFELGRYRTSNMAEAAFLILSKRIAEADPNTVIHMPTDQEAGSMCIVGNLKEET